jgi:alcohol dehydrogenase (NADP+)
MAQQSTQFQGWLAHDKNSIGNLQWGSFEPKPWEETDVDICITHCGICGSDLHTLSSGWVGRRPCSNVSGKHAAHLY